MPAWAGPVKTEEDPLDPTPVPAMRETHAAMRYLEQAVTDAGGIVLRYGGFYGATTTGCSSPCASGCSRSSATAAGSRRSFTSTTRPRPTVLALEHDGAGIYNIVDDEPAPLHEWLPVLANVLGAEPPRHVPRWLARLVAGEAVVMLATESRGASNAKAKRELGWTLRYPSRRQGFVAAYVSTTALPAGRKISFGR
jgi:2-alkyl-3-oxoalkanoate reductase